MFQGCLPDAFRALARGGFSAAQLFVVARDGCTLHLPERGGSLIHECIYNIKYIGAAEVHTTPIAASLQFDPIGFHPWTDIHTTATCL